jgi:23S rRNA (pseudouridine1915-N3)-methyltransferase
MKLVITAVGAMKRAPEAALLEKYIAQCPWNISVKEVDANPKLPPDKRMQAEAEKLRAAIAGKSRGLVIAMDSRGKNLSSEQLAQLLARAQNEGVAQVSFLIGGQDGLLPELVRQADHVIAFGAATWPHMLARVLLAEQLYRAHCILHNHPYHGGH